MSAPEFDYVNVHGNPLEAGWPAVAPGGPALEDRAPESPKSGNCCGRMWGHIKKEAPRTGKLCAIVAIKVACFAAALVLGLLFMAAMSALISPLGGLLIGLPVAAALIFGSRLISDAALKALNWQDEVKFPMMGGVLYF